jgi:hypothetical protein
MVKVGAWWSIDFGNLFEVSFDGGIRGGTVLHGIAEGKAREGGIVSCFDGCKPGGWDWVTCGGMVKVDKSTDAGKLIRIVGLRGSRSGGGAWEKVQLWREGCGGKDEYKGLEQVWPVCPCPTQYPWDPQ